MARRLGLPVADKPDSQDICFVPHGDYARTIEGLRPGAAKPGEIVHVDGRVLGRHQGLIRYTVGQRRGLGIGGGEPLYVIRLEPETNRVIAGPRHELAAAAFRLREVNWLAGGLPGGTVQADFKVRSTRPPLPGALAVDSKGMAKVALGAPEYGVAPGQACVAYDGSRVLGGGWIVAERAGAAVTSATWEKTGEVAVAPA